MTTTIDVSALVMRHRRNAIRGGYVTEAEVRQCMKDIGNHPVWNGELRAACSDALDAVDVSPSNPYRLHNVHRINERDARNDPSARPDLAAERVIVRDENDRQAERLLRRRLGLGDTP